MPYRVIIIAMVMSGNNNYQEYLNYAWCTCGVSSGNIHMNNLHGCIHFLYRRELLRMREHYVVHLG